MERRLPIFASSGWLRGTTDGNAAASTDSGCDAAEHLKAAEPLAKEGISVEVLDPRTLSPLDREALLASVGKTGRLVVAHEAWGPCGVGAEIAAVVAEHGFRTLKAPIRRVTPPFTPVPFSPPMEKFWLPDAERIAAVVREVMA